MILHVPNFVTPGLLLDWDIPKGVFVLIGCQGSGKSTLADVIYGFKESRAELLGIHGLLSESLEGEVKKHVNQLFSRPNYQGVARQHVEQLVAEIITGRTFVFLDDFGDSVSPELARRLVEFVREQAERSNVSVVLATHSATVIQCFNAEPERVFVLERGHATFPVCLTDMRDKDWLANYSLSELYLGGEFGETL